MIALPIYDGHRIAFSVTANDVPGARAVSSKAIHGRVRLATEAVGAATLTLLNVVVGSLWLVETLDGTPVTSGTATATSFDISIAAYANGSSNNQLKLRVRKASAAPFYQPYETQLVISAGVAQSIFVNQVRDDI